MSSAFINQIEEDKGLSHKDLQKEMGDRRKWRKEVKNIWISSIDLEELSKLNNQAPMNLTEFLTLYIYQA